MLITARSAAAGIMLVRRYPSSNTDSGGNDSPSLICSPQDYASSQEMVGAYSQSCPHQPPTVRHPITWTITVELSPDDVCIEDRCGSLGELRGTVSPVP